MRGRQNLFYEIRQRQVSVIERHTGSVAVDTSIDMLAFREKRRRFPDDLIELEGVVWDKKQDRNYSIKYRAMSHGNYFYLCTRIDLHHFTLWAIQMGDLREESPTGFTSVSIDGRRRWEVPALDPDLMRKLNVSPSLAQLGVLGLTEQAGCDFTKEKKRALWF